MLPQTPELPIAFLIGFAVGAVAIGGPFLGLWLQARAGRKQ